MRKKVGIFCKLLEGWFYNCYTIRKVSQTKRCLVSLDRGMLHTYHSSRNKLIIGVIMIYIFKKYICILYGIMQKTSIYVNISMLKDIIITDLLSEILVLYSLHLLLVSNLIQLLSSISWFQKQALELNKKWRTQHVPPVYL